MVRRLRIRMWGELRSLLIHLTCVVPIRRGCYQMNGMSFLVR
jgi:hypothetical protein